MKSLMHFVNSHHWGYRSALFVVGASTFMAYTSLFNRYRKYSTSVAVERDLPLKIKYPEGQA